jgi:hypothetical protein
MSSSSSSSKGLCAQCEPAVQCLFFAEFKDRFCDRALGTHEFGTINELGSRPGCVLCSYIVQLLQFDHIPSRTRSRVQKSQSQQYKITISHQLTTLTQVSPFQMILLDGVSTGMPFIITPASSRLRSWGESRFYDHSKLSIHEIPPWIQDCQANHGETCNHDGAKHGTVDIDLIDLEEMCLVKATTAERYVALSYVNGRFRGFETALSTRKYLLEPGSLGRNAGRCWTISDNSPYYVLGHADGRTLSVGRYAVYCPGRPRE